MSFGAALPWTRSVAAASILFCGTACFSEPDATLESGNDETTGDAGSTTTSPEATTGTSPPDATTTTSVDPDSSDGGSSTSSTASSGGLESNSGTTDSGTVWLCGDQAESYACESFEPDDEVGVDWNKEATIDVMSTLESDPISGTHRHYVLNGEDGMRAQTSQSIDVMGIPSLHIEFDTRFQTEVDKCSTGTGGDLTVFSMARSTVNDPEQLILQVGPTSATLYSTGPSKTDPFIEMEVARDLNEWFHVTLDLDLSNGAAALDVGGAVGEGNQANWLGVEIGPTLDFSFGPASDNDGDTFTGCEFDIDNVLVTTE